ncbi:MAG: hypothetical protein H6736_20075 [Alphaproteobacteria bacterium]|nr:hypothetical protein [Alphaproteobacteria bacterium]
MVWLGLWLAQAQETPDGTPSTWSVTATDDLEIRYWVRDERLPDPSDVPVFNYLEQVNRINVAATKGPWRIRTQVDQVALLANRYYLDDQLYVERPLFAPDIFAPFGKDTDLYANIEKIQVAYETEKVSLELGDFYAAFGRGVALNLNRNVDIDIDTSIQGAKLVWRPGSWDVTALAGQLNRQQVFQDNPNRDLRGDLRHGIVALRAERYGLGPANIGLHAVAYDFVEDAGLAEGFRQLAGGPDVFVGGTTAEIVGLGGIDWYAEYDVFNYTTDRLAGENPPLGHAAYASATFYPGKTVWLVEAKRYSNTQQVNAVLSPELYQVAIAPTLEYERAITEDSAAAVGSRDIWGARVRMDWSLRPGEFVPYIATGIYRDHDLEGLHFNDVPETIIHPMVGVDWLPGDGAALINLGYRRDIRDGREGGSDQQIHGDVTLNFPVAGGFQGNINIGAEHYLWGNNPLQQNDYTESETAWTLSKGPVALTWYMDISSNPLIDSTGNISETLYMAGELQVKPRPNITMKAFYGAYKSGVRCSGGQCRLLPGFEGARTSIVASF